MDFDELKNTWNDMSSSLQSNENLDNEMILNITRRKTRNRLNGIALAESIGIVVCLVLIIYITLNFYKLVNWLDITAGVGILLVLGLSIFMGLKIVLSARGIDIRNQAYSEVIGRFKQLKSILRAYKYASIAAYIVLPVLLLPVVSQLWYGKSLLDDLSEYVESLVAALIILPVIWWLIFVVYRKQMRRISKAISKLGGK